MTYSFEFVGTGEFVILMTLVYVCHLYWGATTSLLVPRARAEAEAILTQYEKEGEAYESILSSNGLGFTTEGFISYMGVRVISSAKNPVFIGLQSPAKSSYMTP